MRSSLDVASADGVSGIVCPLPSADGKKLYAGVGSLSNIAENGMEVEEGRAAIYELDLAGGTSRIFASGLRNAVGLAWEPNTGVLWTVVNERDGLGDETPHAKMIAALEHGVRPKPRFLQGRKGRGVRSLTHWKSLQ